MTGEPITTLIGNLTADPELRFTPSGAAVANFTVAQTPRTKNGDEWVDGEPMFVRCSVWREYAENVAESLQRGQRVIVNGRLKNRSYTTDAGEKRTSLEMEVDEIGPSIRFGTAKFTRAAKDDRRGTAGNQPAQKSRAQQRGGDDPWSTQADPWATNSNDPAPF